jgi:hypothetical protein
MQMLIEAQYQEGFRQPADSNTALVDFAFVYSSLLRASIKVLIIYLIIYYYPRFSESSLKSNEFDVDQKNGAEAP